MYCEISFLIQTIRNLILQGKDFPKGEISYPRQMLQSDPTYMTNDTIGSVVVHHPRSKEVV